MFHCFRTSGTLILMLSSLLLITACEKDGNEELDINSCNPVGLPGELLEANYTLTFNPAQIEPYLSAFGAPAFLDLEYSVDAYSVSYMTLNKNEELTRVSGVMFIPRDIDTLDLISVQHGTVIKRDQVGSVTPWYSLDGLIVAMNGYLVIAPDYLGLGDSQILHPFLHAKLSANPVIDFIRATRVYACENEIILSDNLFLVGYSEGGFVSLATQKIIEAEYSDEIQLTGVAPMAGPHDLSWSTHDLLNRHTYNNPAYLAYIVVAYNDIYEWNRISEIFQEPYASLIPGLYDGNHEGSEINNQLTNAVDQLFLPEFRTSFLAGEEAQIESTLVENSALGWGPIAPVRLIHGTSDSTVLYENSVNAYNSLRDNGGVSVDLIALPGTDHESAAFLAYFLAIEWFDSLRTAQ